MVVATNKVKNIRAGLATNEWLAQHGREYDLRFGFGHREEIDRMWGMG